MQQMMQKQIKQKKNKQYIKYEYRMGCLNSCNNNKNTEWGASRVPGGIPLVGFWRRVHEFSGNVTTAYHGIWADTADLFSDTVIVPATWHGCIFWTCEQVQAIKLDR